MALDLSATEAAVSRNETVDGSAEALIRGINQQIKDAIVADDLQDATQLNALVAKLDESTSRLAAAVAENTPQQPPEGGGGGETGGGTEGGAGRAAR